jgi:hypothetical protein
MAAVKYEHLVTVRREAYTRPSQDKSYANHMPNIKTFLTAKIVRRAFSRANIIGRRRRAALLAKNAVHPSMFGDSLG